ncbi:hypothetical protein J2X72_003656 [Phyllobacterium sp. 1468]|uniref:hypothetical protein n=1 Tax=Phyllobacterium sp. 1468 TaxID=2817759 RepID=UPI001AE2627D|nr:hypothetical protein [Phyllobacterium sp. 1468]MDR6634844.1 hypothetical protein [Phyllobacterium sp. 1468]
MIRLLPALLILLCASEIAAAEPLQSRMLQRQTARAIRNAGFWCDKITDARIDKVRSAGGPTIVQVTCDDQTTFAQYSLTMNATNSKVTKIERWK